MRLASAIAALACAIAIAACGDDEGGPISGSGYEFDLPSGWHDASDQAGDLSEQIGSDIPAGDQGTQYDSVALDKPVDGFASNVNVIVQGSLASSVDSRKLAQSSWRVFLNPELSAQYLPRSLDVVGGPTMIKQIDVGGETGYYFDVDTESAGRRLTQRFVTVVRDGSGYATTFSALGDSFDSELDELESIFDSWRWD
jgi:hypothetical protein